jgi:gas vesicle protein
MKSNVLIPIIAGAAVTAGLAYLLTTEEGEKLRGKLAGHFNEEFRELAEQLTNLKEQFLSAVTEKPETA